MLSVTRERGEEEKDKGNMSSTGNFDTRPGNCLRKSVALKRIEVRARFYTSWG